MTGPSDYTSSSRFDRKVLLQITTHAQLPGRTDMCHNRLPVIFLPEGLDGARMVPAATRSEYDLYLRADVINDVNSIRSGPEVKF